VDSTIIKYYNKSEGFMWGKNVFWIFCV